jgi:hypothetical protein
VDFEQHWWWFGLFDGPGRSGDADAPVLPGRGGADDPVGRSETEWHRITCFIGIGKCVAEHVTKGAIIMVTGRIHYSRWTDSEGQTRYGCEIVAEQVDFLARAKEARNEEPKKRRSKSRRSFTPRRGSRRSVLRLPVLLPLRTPSCPCDGTA